MTEFMSDGVAIRAFLARPGGIESRAGARPDGERSQRPTVVIIQEWWGLTEHIQDIARRLAEAGFVALAPDLYSRQGNKVTKDPNEAAALMNALSSQQVLLDLNQAVNHLKSLPFVDPWAIGMMGFCMGGTFALTQATHNSDLKASVAFYGKVPPIESVNYLLCPVLFHHGAKDGWVTVKEVQTLQQGLEKYGKPGQIYSYPEADHAFFNNTRPEVYRPDDAKLAWERTLAFLKEHLRT